MLFGSASIPPRPQLRDGHQQQLDRRAQLQRELSASETRLGRLVDALVSGGAMETVVEQIKTEEL